MIPVRDYRRNIGDAYQYNWTLKIPELFQQSFNPSHENMANLDLHLDQPAQTLAANLRRAFSGIVAGNIKDEGIKSVQKHGKFQLSGDPELMRKMDSLLMAFIKQGRMKLPGSVYEPCYEIKT